jgi:hypothetical protein
VNGSGNRSSLTEVPATTSSCSSRHEPKFLVNDVRVPINHPCWSGSVLVLVENAAESVASADVRVGYPVRADGGYG